MPSFRALTTAMTPVRALFVIPDFVVYRYKYRPDAKNSPSPWVPLSSEGAEPGPYTRGTELDRSDIFLGLASHGGAVAMPAPGLTLTPGQARAKRIFDVSASCALVLLTLVLLVLVAVLIKATSRGPVLFRQPRVGQFNQVFTCYKFRTMRHEAADLLAEQQTIPGDPRITPLGRWLRRTSIDELPQLLNVIKGDMSLVGPRPHAPRTKVGDRLFHEVVPHYHHRHAVLPGITGWAQVNGLRGQTSTEDALVRRVDFDMHYIHSWSLWFDLRILVMTAMREIYSKHAF